MRVFSRRVSAVGLGVEAKSHPVRKWVTGLIIKKNVRVESSCFRNLFAYNIEQIWLANECVCVPNEGFGVLRNGDPLRFVLYGSYCDPLPDRSAGGKQVGWNGVRQCTSLG